MGKNTISSHTHTYIYIYIASASFQTVHTWLDRIQRTEFKIYDSELNQPFTQFPTLPILTELWIKSPGANGPALLVREVKFIGYVKNFKTVERKS